MAILLVRKNLEEWIFGHGIALYIRPLKDFPLEAAPLKKYQPYYIRF
jgi:hypothetical protein